MGQLTIPPSQYVYVDANAVIYSVEKIEPYSNTLAAIVGCRSTERFSGDQQRTDHIGDARQTSENIGFHVRNLFSRISLSITRSPIDSDYPDDFGTRRILTSNDRTQTT